MSTLEEVRQMKSQGMSQEQIIDNLRSKRVPYKEISDALAQSDIQAAVSQAPSMGGAPPTAMGGGIDPGMPGTGAPAPGSTPPMPSNMPATPPPMPPPTRATVTGGTSGPPMPGTMVGNPPMPQDAGMMPSQMYEEDTVPQEMGVDPFPVPSDMETSEEEMYPEGFGDSMGGFSGDYGGMSADTITEIAEQIVAEKISEIRKPLEKILNFRTEIESKMESAEERLKRLEITIHTLESSVLGKVGEFMSNVNDIKKELVETQRTFAKITQAKEQKAAEVPKTKPKKQYDRLKRSRAKGSNLSLPGR